MRCARFEVEATALPFVVKEEIAKDERSARVWEDRPNLSQRRACATQARWTRHLANAPRWSKDSITTAVQIHHPLETHGNTVSWNDDGVTCWASTQGITSVRRWSGRHHAVPQSQVRVISEFMGGGFGAKFGPGVEGGLAARLSKEAKAPVKADADAL